MPSHQKMYTNPGHQVLIECPYSEVCMHMQVAGKTMWAELRLCPEGCDSVQLYRLDGSVFSGPITPGEAGFYQDNGGYYYYLPFKEV